MTSSTSGPAGRDRSYSISDLCREFGVTGRTLRFYEQKGLLSPGRRGWTRLFTYRDRARLQTLMCQRIEMDETIAELERTCEIVEGMLKERLAKTSGAAA